MGKFSGTKELIQADLTAMSYLIISRETDVPVPVLGEGRRRERLRRNSHGLGR